MPEAATMRSHDDRPACGGTPASSLLAVRQLPAAASGHLGADPATAESAFAAVQAVLGRISGAETARLRVDLGLCRSLAGLRQGRFAAGRSAAESVLAEAAGCLNNSGIHSVIALVSPTQQGALAGQTGISAIRKAPPGPDIRTDSSARALADVANRLPNGVN